MPSQKLSWWILLPVHLILIIGGPNNAVSAQAIPIFAPPEANSNFDGNSAFNPFDLANPARFQQVYSSSLFNILTGVGGSIAEVTFRVDLNIGRPFTATIPSIQLSLSTTSRGPDGLSSIFDENVGSDNTVVIDLSAVSIGSNGGGGFTTFDLNFIFDTPFEYHPEDGNLLFDFQIHKGIRGGLPTSPPPPLRIATLDAFDVVGDSISSVYGFGPMMPNGGQISSLGLATRFAVVAVPEPSTMTLLALALGALALGWMKKGKG